MRNVSVSLLIETEYFLLSESPEAPEGAFRDCKRQAEPRAGRDTGSSPVWEKRSGWGSLFYMPKQTAGAAGQRPEMHAGAAEKARSACPPGTGTILSLY